MALTVDLLVLPSEPMAQAFWAWNHDQHHRFRTPTYLLDPLQNVDEPGSKWHQDHQIAHNVMATGSFILRDTDLTNPLQRAWWEFANHLEHYVAG